MEDRDFYHYGLNNTQVVKFLKSKDKQQQMNILGKQSKTNKFIVPLAHRNMFNRYC